MANKGTLTNEQKRAIEVIDRPVSIIAGAGSGKTRVLTERYAGIIRNAKTCPDNILAITFTEKAASEMRSRLASLLPEHEAAIHSGPISTIHAFCARILRDNAARLGIDPKAALLDESASRLLVHRTAKSAILDLLRDNDPSLASLMQLWGFKGLLACIEELLSFEWHAKAIINAPLPSGLGSEERRMMEVIFACFKRCLLDIKQHKKDNNLLDFQDLEIMTLKLLSQDTEIRDIYQRKFSHILVDEFQDTNDIQMELINRLWNPEKNILCIVGDPAQSIYRFRGANVACFHGLTDRIVKAGGEVIHLTRNFRSRDGVLRAVNLICEPLFKTDDGGIPFEPLVADRGDEGVTPFSVIGFEAAKDVNAEERRTAEAAAVANEILRLREEGFKFSDVTCLFQSLSKIEIYEEALRKSGIPYRTSGGNGFLRRQEVRDIMTLLKAARMIRDNEVSDLTVYALLRSPFIGLFDDDCYRLRFARPLDAANPPVDGRFYRDVRDTEHGALFRALEDIVHHQGVSGIIRAALELTNAELVWHAIDPLGQAQANIEKLIGMAEALEQEEACSLDYFIDYINDLQDRNARIADAPPLSQGEDAVHLMTVHASKGLEFPAVFLCDTFLNVGPKSNRWCFVRGKGFAVKVPDPDDPFDELKTTPHYDSIFESEAGEDSNERARLLYVAMTRARDRLYICRHAGYKRGGLWHKWIEEADLPAISIDLMNTICHPRACPPLSLSGNSKMCHPRESGDPESTDIVRERDPCLRRDDITCRDDITLRSDITCRDDITRRGDINCNDTIKAYNVQRSLTVSHLEAFYRCPQEYNLKYVLNVPSTNLDITEGPGQKGQGLPANILGDIAHTMIEQLHADPGTDRESLLKARLMQNHVPGIEWLSSDDRRRIERIIDAYENFDREHRYDEIRFEHPFCLRTSRALINGKIDLLGRRNNAYEIVDYKTDRIDDPSTIKASADKYRLQMEIYGLAASLALKEPVEKATLCFLNTRDGRAVPHELKLSPPAETMERIEKILIAVAKGPVSYDIPKAPPCERCAFHRNGTCDKDILRGS